MTRVVLGMSTHKPVKGKPHVVESVHFAPGWSADAGEVTCSCGWEGTVGQWPAHGPRLSVSRSWRDDAGEVYKMRGTRVISAATL